MEEWPVGKAPQGVEFGFSPLICSFFFLNQDVGGKQRKVLSHRHLWGRRQTFREARPGTVALTMLEDDCTGQFPELQLFSPRNRHACPWGLKRRAQHFRGRATWASWPGGCRVSDWWWEMMGTGDLVAEERWTHVRDIYGVRTAECVGDKKLRTVKMTLQPFTLAVRGTIVQAGMPGGEWIQ